MSPSPWAQLNFERRIVLDQLRSYLSGGPGYEEKILF
jgi:hypothetical protein